MPPTPKPVNLTHYIVTNRAIKTEDGEESIVWNGRTAARRDLRFATVKMSSAEARIQLIRDLVVPEGRSAYDIPAGTDPDSLTGSERVFRRMLEFLASGRNVMLFIQGYATNKGDTIGAIEGLHKRYAVHGTEPGTQPLDVIVSFSWPANGSLDPNEYWNDASDARQAGAVLARFIMKLGTFLQRIPTVERESGKLFLLAHSMGNQVLAAMMGTLDEEHRKLTMIFDEVFMLAPDLRNNVFEPGYQLHALPDITRRVSVYYRSDDVAQRISQGIHGDDRLGHCGPRSMTLVPPGIAVINASDVSSSDAKGLMAALHDRGLSHWYYLTSPKVIADITAIMEGTPSDDSGLARKIDAKTKHYVLT